MEHEINEEIFERYNPTTDMVRCPYGRSGVRQQLDLYAKAAVNLYGLISREELVEIFNEQNGDQTTVEELYILLLPLVRKEGWYGFYKDYVIHDLFFDAFDKVENWAAAQGDKPRYVPDKEEFISYAEEDNIRNEQFAELSRWFHDIFGFSRDIAVVLAEIRGLIKFGGEVSKLGEAFSRYGIVFPDEETSTEFYERYINASNNQRLWENKGHTPSELAEILNKQNENIIPFPQVQERTKIGRNEPCPCGSGKKYKKCCGLLKDSRTAQLSEEEAAEFYQTFYELLAFVNDEERVLKRRIHPETLDAVTDLQYSKVSDVLWEKPQLIDDYISKGGLSEEAIHILKGWRTRFMKGWFLVLEYHNDHAVFMATVGEGEQAGDRLFAVKGLNNPVSDILSRQLPVHVETVLLPFKGKIVYNTFLSSYDVGYGTGARKMFQKLFSEAKKHGLITDLEQVDLKLSSQLT